MFCKYCRTDKPEEEFDVLNKEIYGGDGKYRCKRCHSCRIKMINKKNGSTKLEYSVCKCGEKFEKKLGKNGRYFVKCPNCRTKHAKEQNNSTKKLYTESAIKSGASLLDNVDKIDKNKLMEMVANKIAEKLLNKL
jgi:hypothetical protein